MSGALVRYQCAAITRGCMSALVLPFGIDREAALRANGWHMDHGRWVCGAHETRPCTCATPHTAHNGGAPR